MNELSEYLRKALPYNNYNSVLINWYLFKIENLIN
jgi:hypothetical protein